ncbi:MAG TPA: polysaccharide biosynthesis tyrosine autokinase [Candidatus Cybelea sp.]|jgi:capsular exopolysaccharide synthesis family protein|nr:polysaccharide biosynthesis tyrosine autokinase [Candidatus Cybelea sp.]
MSEMMPYNGQHNGLAGFEGQPQFHEGRDVERLYRAILKRWRLFVAVAGGFALIVTLGTLIAPKSYTTTVRLLAGRSDTSTAPVDNTTALPVLNALVLQSGEQSAETFAALAQQRDIATSVIDQLNVKATPKQLLANVSVQPVVNTSLLNLNVTWSSPERSAEIANAFSNAFVEEERDFVRSQAVAAIGFLSKEMPDAAKEMHDSASRLAKFQSAHGYIDATAHAQDVVSRVSQLNLQIDQLTVDVREAQALLGSTTGQLAAMSSTVDSAKQVGQNPVATDLQTKLADVQAQLGEAEQKYTPAHPAVISLRQQRDALLAQISAQPQAVVSSTTVAPNPLYQSLEQQAATYRARVMGDQGQIKALRGEVKANKPAVNALPEQAIAFSSLQEDAKRAANVYNALAQKYSDAIVAKTTAISDIIVVQPANADSAVKRPSLRTNLPIAIVLGVLLGLAVVYILDLIERRGAGRDFARILGLPVVARIPAFDERKSKAIPWVHSMTMEAFLHLCVTLRLRNRRPIKTLAVLSARRSEGKSTVAFNLAKTLATLQPGVLLVDADLRQPTLHTIAACKNNVGLGEVLEGTSTLDAAVQHLDPGLDILPSHPDNTNPIPLLQSRLESMLETARKTYSTVIVDTPALGAVSDGLMVAAQVDGSLFVVAADETEEGDARRAIGQLSLIGIDNVLGIVVNKDAVVVNDYDDYFARMHNALAAGPA